MKELKFIYHLIIPIIIALLFLFLTPLILSSETKSRVPKKAAVINTINEFTFLKSNTVEGDKSNFYKIYLFSAFSSISKSIIATIFAFIVCLIFSFLISYKFENLLKSSEAFFSALRFLPSIAWLPLLAFIKFYGDDFGLLFFIFLGTSPLILTQILHGLRFSSRNKKMVGLISPSSKFKIYRKIIMPDIYHDLILSLRYGMGLSLILVLVYETLFESIFGISRIIEPLSASYSLLDSIGFIIIVASLGLLVDRLTLTSEYVFDAIHFIQAKRSYSV